MLKLYTQHLTLSCSPNYSNLLSLSDYPILFSVDLLFSCTVPVLGSGDVTIKKYSNLKKHVLRIFHAKVNIKPDLRDLGDAQPHLHDLGDALSYVKIFFVAVFIF